MTRSLRGMEVVLEYEPLEGPSRKSTSLWAHFDPTR
jgi:hypothetical protein